MERENKGVIDNMQFTYICGHLMGMITWLTIIAIVLFMGRSGRKPIYKKPTDKYEDGSWICPRCGGTVGFYDMADKYCSECGQKIDWSK